jgi:uncharacterized zinc-type alcohol dehydrogenase-like protein
MAKNILGYATHSATAALEPFQFQRRAQRKNDVEIEILYCGVCHSDLHQARNDWSNSIYPMVPGHEIVGKVISIGSDVKRFNLGDTVGVGCMVDSCQHCSPCEHGLEQYCENGHTLTYNAIDRHDKLPTFGGYSERILVSDKFVLKVPDSLELEGVGPLLCAGITTWSPLRHWKVGKHSKVAVIGLGGLGHMGLKLAKALGANVTLFTRSPGKETDARRLGAHEIVLSTNQEEMVSVNGKFDLIIDTVPYIHDLNPYIPTLSLNGTLVLVGYLGGLEPTLNTMSLILGRKSVAGSVIGGIEETQEMLDFCGKHRITADVEMIKIQEINEAYERMLKSDVKYRFVIDMSSLKT